MSIDEQVYEYMTGWNAGCAGADPRIASPERRIATTKPAWSRGVRDGATARLAAEQAERERLERCDAPGLDNDELALLERDERANAIGHYHRRTGVRMSLAEKIVDEWYSR